jgi:hypothetical protein
MAAFHRHRRWSHRTANLVSRAQLSSLFANLAASITVLVTGSSTAAVSLALCGSTAIITSSPPWRAK